MKTLLHTLVFTFIFLSSSSLNAQTTAEVTGFRKIKWGSYIDSIHKDGQQVLFFYHKETKEERYYYVEDDKLNIGSAQMHDLYYVFNYDGRFIKVFMNGKPEGVDDINAILRKKFGEPTSDKNQDGRNLQVWKINDVTFELVQNLKRGNYALTIEGNWREQQNATVDDF